MRKCPLIRIRLEIGEIGMDSAYNEISSINLALPVEKERSAVKRFFGYDFYLISLAFHGFAKMATK